MAQMESGNSDSPVAPAHRTGHSSLFEEDHVGQRGEQRRAKHYANPNFLSLFDLLFEEVDNFDGIDEPLKDKLRQSLRRSVRRRNRERGHSSQQESGSQQESDPQHPDRHSPSPEPVHIQQVVVPADTVSTERLAEIASQAEDENSNEQIVEARRLAEQLHYCLTQHSETSQKVATYLRALMVLNGGHYKPKMIIQV
ncbi:conserved hypothetical protein [Azospirillaceae bacterium]